jgi:hypothetical protein
MKFLYRRLIVAAFRTELRTGGNVATFDVNGTAIYYEDTGETLRAFRSRELRI